MVSPPTLTLRHPRAPRRGRDRRRTYGTATLNLGRTPSRPTEIVIVFRAWSAPAEQRWVSLP